MSAAPHDDLSALLGPAALGLLSPDEERVLDVHLAGCAACREELRGLDAVVTRLGDLDGEEALLQDASGGAERVDAVMSAVTAARRADQQRASRRQGVLAAAAAVAVLAAGLVSATALSRPAAPSVPLEAVAVAATGGGVEARADLVAHTWGVEIKLVATGLGEGEAYDVEVLTTSGRAVDAGAFLGTGADRLLCNLNTSVLRDDATGFRVLDRSGREVLTADL